MVLTPMVPGWDGGEEEPYYYCNFTVDEVLIGHPEHVSQGKKIVVTVSSGLVPENQICPR